MIFMRRSDNPYIPAEAVFIHQPIGLEGLGSLFSARAPFTACRLCGSLYQSTLDLHAQELADGGFINSYLDVEGNKQYYGDTNALELYFAATNRRHRWLEIHNRRKHADAGSIVAIELLEKLGWAFMPAAAHKLTSYGIFPMGNKHEEIIDAMATAARAPSDDPEGL